MATWDLGKVVGADGKSATLEITGVQNLPYGSDPVITEEVDSTPLARKYRLGIPAGKPGTNAGGGGAGIDDGSVATDTTYSSVKIEAIANQLSQQTVNYRTAVNLLDNSDWRIKKNIVNQRGLTSYVGNGYTIDRWRTWAENAVVNIADGYISHDENLMQYILNADKDAVYTFAVCDSDNNIHICTGVPINTPAADGLALGYEASLNAIYANIYATIWGIKWAALYEGAYTAANLPPYRPKGYANELAECLNYYRYFPYLALASSTWGFYSPYIRYDAPMRKAPTSIKIYSYGNKTEGCFKDVNDNADVTGAQANNADKYGFRVQSSAGNLVVGHTYHFYVEINNDL